MTNPATIHNLAADISDRIEGMQCDAKWNNAQVIESLLKPVYEELTNTRIKLSLAIMHRCEVEREVEQLKEKLKSLNAR
jgi:hypothetical protein